MDALKQSPNTKDGHLVETATSPEDMVGGTVVSPLLNWADDKQRALGMDKALVDALLEYRMEALLEDRDTWTFLESMNVVTGKSAEEMQNRFMSCILPNLEKNFPAAIVQKFKQPKLSTYTTLATFSTARKRPRSPTAPDPQFDDDEAGPPIVKDRSSGSRLSAKVPKGKRKKGGVAPQHHPYTREEDLDILRAMSTYKGPCRLSGVAFWQGLAQKDKWMKNRRPWSSLKERFRRRIYPCLLDPGMYSEIRMEIKQLIKTRFEPKQIDLEICSDEGEDSASSHTSEAAGTPNERSCDRINQNNESQLEVGCSSDRKRMSPNNRHVPERTAGQIQSKSAYVVTISSDEEREMAHRNASDDDKSAVSAEAFDSEKESEGGAGFDDDLEYVSQGGASELVDERIRVECEAPFSLDSTARTESDGETAVQHGNLANTKRITIPPFSGCQNFSKATATNKDVGAPNDPSHQRKLQGKKAGFTSSPPKMKKPAKQPSALIDNAGSEDVSPEDAEAGAVTEAGLNQKRKELAIQIVSCLMDQLTSTNSEARELAETVKRQLITSSKMMKRILRESKADAGR